MPNPTPTSGIVDVEAASFDGITRTGYQQKCRDGMPVPIEQPEVSEK